MVDPGSGLPKNGSIFHESRIARLPPLNISAHFLSEARSLDRT